MARNSSPDEDHVRSPRQPRTQRKTLAGLDLDPEEDGDDDEYDESGVKADDNDEIENDDNDDNDEIDDENEIDENDIDNDAAADDDDHYEEEDDVAVAPKRRGRKRKAPTEDPDDEAPKEEPEAKDGEVKEEEAEVPKRKGKKRGRKPKIRPPEDVFYDDKGNEINVKNDEVVIEDEDPKGREKIDENGFLQGDRKFRIKTFTLLGKGERQYMVSTEPARLVGFRDSYLLFKTHLTLFKKVCTHEEKMDLIQRHLIPTSYKGRSVNLVTARSIYREFGARMLVGGKKVIDDFWEEKARERGDVEGEYADPEEPSKTGPGGDHFQAQITGSALINYQADPTWMYQVAMQTVEFNKSLTEARNQVWLRGIKDTYSGFNFYPQSSQPTRCKFEKLADAKDTLSCSLKLQNPNIRKTVTGLASVPKEVFDDMEDEEVKKAILEQQDYERRVYEQKL